MRRVRRAFLLLLGALAACRPTGVNSVEVRVRVAPASLDFGTPWTETTERRTLIVTNDSRLEVNAQLAVAGLVFGAPGTVALAPGDTLLEVSATSALAGAATGTLTLSVEGREAALVPLSVTFRDPPDCGQASECATLRFDRASSQCLFSPRPEGTPCGATDRCLVGGRCVAGECVGEPVRCASGDPCVIDVCETVRGCVTLPRECPSPSACLRGVCSPALGCHTVPAPDGLRCGDVGRTSCTSVEICVNGACAERDPPDGYLCAPATPCRGEGRCQGDVCQLPPASALPMAWAAGGPREDGGVGDVWTDVFIDHDGGVVLSSYFATPPLVQAPNGQRLPTSSRRCIAWNELVVCADTPPQGVTAVSAASGLPVWRYTTVLDDLPSLQLADWETFLARLVALGPSRLGVLFESRRIDELRRETNCRRFSLVVLDDTGRRIVARLLDDPIFATCNHPHSYGVAADPQGNVFFAFTPSAQVSPALPDPNAAGTVIMSFSPAGVRRWRHFIPAMPGGEIAVGRGLITVEAGRSIYDAARGVVVGGFSIPFGEGLIANDWVVAGPKGENLELREPGSADVVAHQPTGQLTSRSGLRGATFGGQPIALRLSEQNGAALVEAFSLRRFQGPSAERVWACEIPDGGSPVSFEVRPGGLAVMTDPIPGGAGLCESCDPPWAGTQGRFFEVLVPGVLPPSMPWPGPWGGPGHDHQED